MRTAPSLILGVYACLFIVVFSQNIKSPIYSEQFTIWACASLLHVPYTELPELIEGLLNTLTDDDVFYASFKYGHSERIKDGRFFCDMNAERWEALKQKVSYQFKDKTWLTTDQRADRNEEWYNVMLETKEL